MVRRFLKENNFVLLLTAILFCNVLTACAQNKENLLKVEKYKAIENELLLFNNASHALPIKEITDVKMASVNFNFEFIKTFDSLLNKYSKVDKISTLKYADSTTYNDLEDDLRFYDILFVPVTEKQISNKKIFDFISSVSSKKTVIVSYFGTENGLLKLENLRTPILWTGYITEEAAFILPQAIFGGVAVRTNLEYNIGTKFTKGSGYTTSVSRLKYTLPEDVQVNSNELAQIDSIALETIREKAAPGLVVLVAKGGKVIYNKSFGYHTYANLKPNSPSDIFDLASVTKITATTPAIMRLVEQGKLNLDLNVGHYIPKARNTPMNSTVVRDVMMHQAGFIPFIPFHNFVKEDDYSRDSTRVYNVKVADSFYVKKKFYTDFMWPKMLNSPIVSKGRYVYSDISMYVMKDIAEHISRKPITEYLDENFYKPLGMQFTGFLPRKRFSIDQIVPTEEDVTFRKTLLNGYVHDQGAALAGGVAGHAGLFGNANDLAIFYQMLLNKGTYGGKKYFDHETVEQFTVKQSVVSRRGLGFDRWDPDPKNKYPSELASDQTYGHTGYTGIGVWVDPARDMIYIFLSNRVHPKVSDKLGNLAIRRRIQDVINVAIDNGKK